LEAALALISVVTPCLNAAETLSDMLSSLAPQMAKDIEVIMADGGSVDDSRGLAERSGFVRVLPGKDDSLYEGLMRGVAAARGNYVLFLNADDKLADGAINAARKALGRAPGAPMASGGLVVEGDQYYRAMPDGILTPAAALFGLPAINARFYHRSLFENFRFEPEYGLAADRLFLFRLALAKVTGVAIGQSVCRYRSHPGSRTIGATAQSHLRAVNADVSLALALVRKSEFVTPEYRPTLRAWAALQSLRAIWWRIPTMGGRPWYPASLPAALFCWQRYRGMMAGW
jgi:glycosyltransferase involved in cell wall biosynthesis